MSLIPLDTDIIPDFEELPGKNGNGLMDVVLIMDAGETVYVRIETCPSEVLTGLEISSRMDMVAIVEAGDSYSLLPVRMDIRFPNLYFNDGIHLIGASGKKEKKGKKKS